MGLQCNLDCQILFNDDPWFSLPNTKKSFHHFKLMKILKLLFISFSQLTSDVSFTPKHFLRFYNDDIIRNKVFVPIAGNVGNKESSIKISMEKIPAEFWFCVADNFVPDQFKMAIFIATHLQNIILATIQGMSFCPTPC